MKKLLFVWVVILFGYSAFAQNTNRLLEEYIVVKDALVNSDTKVAAQAAEALYQSISKEENFAQKQNLLKAVGQLRNAGNLEKQRASLNEVSIVLWKLVNDSDKINQAVYYQYCPMKKAYWLSREKEIKNPYYGSSMLTCGKVTETKK